MSNIKPIIIVDAFFHDESCLDEFKKYLSFVKKAGYPIMLVTNSKFDPILIEEVDYILYDKNDRLFKKEYPNTDVIFIWYHDAEKYFSIENKALQKHGLSVISNLYHSTNLAKSLGYTHFFRIEYDCTIYNIEKIKDIVEQVKIEEKKGYIYVNQNSFISFQMWYFDLDYFTSIFPVINTEEDYIDIKKSFGIDEDRFVIVEHFVLDILRNSKDGFNNLIVKDSQDLYLDFPNAAWNTLISPSESDHILNGFVSSIHKVAYKVEGIQEQYCPIDKNKFSIISWNCSTRNENKSIITILKKDKDPEIIEHYLTGENSHKITIIDLDNEEVEIRIKMNDYNYKTFFVNPNNIDSVTNILTLK